ncbi:hypothetical protein MVEN_02513000 [Mycena venus]|uniref:HD domain-containing protein n=1 Tax=Mycena venus TaxID=2733690 RepID=A0A8H6U421_9AGAR|nr:hypothetical protein MVEN_02513000 [Mycena venus]
MPFPKTFDAFITANFSHFLESAQIRPNYISFNTLQFIPLDDAHKDVAKYTEKLLPNLAFGHSVRAYYFALAMLHNGFPSGTPGVPQINFKDLQRKLYHACAIHDIGWTTHPDVASHPARTMSFELFGGILAFEHLRTVASYSNGSRNRRHRPKHHGSHHGLSWT